MLNVLIFRNIFIEPRFKIDIHVSMSTWRPVLTLYPKCVRLGKIFNVWSTASSPILNTCSPHKDRNCTDLNYSWPEKCVWFRVQWMSEELKGMLDIRLDKDKTTDQFTAGQRHWMELDKKELLKISRPSIEGYFKMFSVCMECRSRLVNWKKHTLICMCVYE